MAGWQRPFRCPPEGLATSRICCVTLGDVSEKDDYRPLARGAAGPAVALARSAQLARFGSVVRDEARAESDLDVLVEFDQPIDLFAFLALEEELAGLVGRRVDLVSRAALKRHMGRRIVAEAVPL